MQCASYLLFFIGDVPNSHSLRPNELAARAGHEALSRLVAHVEKRRESESSEGIFGCSFSELVAIVGEKMMVL